MNNLESKVLRYVSCPSREVRDQATKMPSVEIENASPRQRAREDSGGAPPRPDEATRRGQKSNTGICETIFAVFVSSVYWLYRCDAMIPVGGARAAHYLYPSTLSLLSPYGFEEQRA